MMEHFELDPGFKISRIIKGGWQLSKGHGDLSGIDPVQDMIAFSEAGITTFDCADIYTGVEELIGRFMAQNERNTDKNKIKVLTKFVPDYDKLAGLNKQYIEKIIDRSLKRLNLEQLDMVQYSWWTYQIPGWVETAVWLQELQKAGKINLISTTNFNTEKTMEILEAGVNLATVQVQYSMLDRRVEKSLIKLCAMHNIHLLCYGTVAGGFLSEKWLGKLEPKAPFENRSLNKYKLMIDEVGGWDVFQGLLQTLKSIATRHEVSITNIASRYILDKPQVAGIIIGARNTSHLKMNNQTFEMKLLTDDSNQIQAALSRLSLPAGDFFDLERDRNGPHGRIMKYNLNDK